MLKWYYRAHILKKKKRIVPGKPCTSTTIALPINAVVDSAHTQVVA